MKDLAKKSGITYTTLMSMVQKPVDTWKTQNQVKVSSALGEDIIASAKIQAPTPFIKWVGGKRQLLPQLKKYIPNNFETYFEPFVGGGALLLALQPERAVINDFNPDLYFAWSAVKEDLHHLTELLAVHQNKNSKEYYLDIRSMDRDGRIVRLSDTERAARFIYMNKTGFNGLWRVNSKGQNNVPFGTYTNPQIVPPSLPYVSKYLSRNDVQIFNLDYQDIMDSAKQNDFVYFDPPYIPVNLTSTFTSYTAGGFGLVQQEELRDLALELASDGVSVMLSNADVPLTKELYQDKAFKIHHVKANRAINSKATGRGKIGEVIITTY
ncbi:site-specific DNA methylase [Lacticaseibacillus brantae DSM 23927]|uniref:Site-specific DNA-methyltransferase (adenine-specific) n=2 Tax=Lacticaseibacillus brantae TaxID=943673 RepID=A0A0R2AVM2_9LACO|nr:site-specific DNA methylase [Lacticaseibacillus brantae DSM 23927]